MKKLWCLFIALALNVAFTYAQSVWLMPYPAIPVDPAWDHRLLADLSSVPWLRVRIDSIPGQANDVAVISLKEPTVTRVDNEWKITFKKD